MTHGHQHTTMIRSAAVLLVGLFCITATYAQETLTIEKKKSEETILAPAVEERLKPQRMFSLGAFGGYALDINAASELVLPDIPSCCPGYDGAMGGGFVGGLGIELPLSNSLEFVGRLTFHATSVSQTKLEPITVRQGNQAVSANITHELTSSMSVLSVEPLLLFKLGERFGLVGGLRAGMLMGATYDQQERLDESIPYTYNGSAVRNASSGTLPQTSAFQLGLVLGARYALPMNAAGTLRLVPEVQFSPLFTSIISGQSWSVHSLRMMLGLQYDLMRMVPEASPLSPR